MGREAPPQTYETSDLYFAAFLKTAKCKIVRFNKVSDSKVIFIFEWTPHIDDLSLEWTNRTAQVSALDYADNIRNLKSQCHSLSRKK